MNKKLWEASLSQKKKSIEPRKNRKIKKEKTEKR